MDAQGGFAGITSENVRMPAERHTLYHAQWVRELLERGLLKALWWIDTRDCCADGLTKGTVCRSALQAVMQGLWHVVHDCKRWSAK